MGPEWNQLWTHVMSLTKDDLLLGLDYKKWDVTQQVSVTSAAMGVFIDVAKTLGYCQSDLTMMASIATDVIMPFLDWNGTLITCTNVIPSGVPITAVLNTIVNNLRRRVALFELVGVCDFREKVAGTAYGDDNIQSVSEDCTDRFNYFTLKDFFKEYKIDITPADKEGNELAFWKSGDMDYLKRRNVDNPDIGTSLGALDRASMFKSLHSGIRPKALKVEGEVLPQTLEDTSRQVLRGFLHESFAHGRSTFESDQEKVIEVAARHDLYEDHLAASYDERVQKWKDDYLAPPKGEGG